MTQFQIPMVLLTVLSAVALGLAGEAEPNVPSVHHAQGELAGEATATTVLLQSRLTAIAGLDADGDVPGAAGVARFEWSESADFANAQLTPWLEAGPDRDFVVRAKLEGLKPGTLYHYRLIFGRDREHTRRGPTRKFRTLLPADGTGRVAFCVGSCMNYHAFMSGKPNGGGPVTATEQDRRLGYPVFAAMAELRPDFFVGTGDIVYYDHPASSAAQTLPQLRKKWHEQFRFPRMVEFFAATPAYWSKDDHDFRFNDADLSGKKPPLPSTGIDLFREQMPIFAADDRTSPTYRTHRVHRHLQLWLTEGRDYRSPNKTPDGPDKSLWGRQQREWLQASLAASTATWKVIVSPTPMVGPDRNSKTDNHANLGGFHHEAESFFAWLRDSKITGVLIVCGDRHWQYHSVHPLGVEEFAVGALNDENAIRGVRPGDKNSTDPKGLIKQPYLYAEPTGGFLHIVIAADAADPAKLLIEHRDDHGQVLNSVAKSAPAAKP